MKRSLVALVTATWLLASHVSAHAVTVDFEGFPDLADLSNAIPGLTFSNAIVLKSFFAGGSLFDQLFPPRSGENVAGNNDVNQGIRIDFAGQVTTVEGFFTYGQGPLTLTAFDAGDLVVGTDSLNNQFSTNTGDPNDLNNALDCGVIESCTPNELLSVAFAPGIAYVTIEGVPGFSFTLDDLSFISAVPEPSTLLLMGSGLAMLLGWQGMRRRSNT